MFYPLKHTFPVMTTLSVEERSPFQLKAAVSAAVASVTFQMEIISKGGGTTTSGILLKIHLNSLFGAFHYAFNANVSRSYCPWHNEAPCGRPCAGAGRTGRRGPLCGGWGSSSLWLCSGERAVASGCPSVGIPRKDLS